MGLESSVTYINDLNELWPLNGDGQSAGAAHIRYDKKAMKNTFPNANRAYNVEAMISRNKIINGGMDIWQRASSFALSTTNQFTADRWGALQATSAAATISRQSAGTAGSFFCMRVQRNSGSSATGVISIAQALESNTCRQFQGKQVVLSFKARKGANYSATSDALAVTLYESAAETSTSSLHTATGWTSVVSEGKVLTTSFQTFEVVGTVGASSAQLGVRFTFSPTGTAGANDYFEITDVKIELGGTASLFEPEHLALEFARCKRHYQRLTVDTAGDAFGSGGVNTTTTAALYIPFTETMRIAPSTLEQSGTASDYQVFHGNTNTVCSAVPTYSRASGTGATVIFTVAAGLTVGQAAIATSATTSAVLGFSADL